MASTPLMQLPIPIEDENPFFATIQAFFAALDAWVQAIREDGGVFVAETGGTWSVGPGDVVNWSAPIAVQSATDGGRATAGAGSVACLDGELVYMTIPSRPIAGALAGVIAAGPSLPALDGLAIPIAFRSGSTVKPLGRGTASGGGGGTANPPGAPSAYKVVGAAYTLAPAADNGLALIQVAAGGTITLVAPDAQGRNIWIAGPALAGAATLDFDGLPVAAQWIPRYGAWAGVSIPQGNGLRLLSVENPLVPGSYTWSVWEVFGTVSNPAAPTEVWMSAHFGHKDPEVFADRRDFTADQVLDGTFRGVTVTNGGAPGAVNFTLIPDGFAVGDRLWIWKVNKRQVRIYADPGTIARMNVEGVEFQASANQGIELGEQQTGVEIVVHSVGPGAVWFRVRRAFGVISTLFDSSDGLSQIRGFDMPWQHPRPRRGGYYASGPAVIAGPGNRGGGAGEAGGWTPRVLHGELPNSDGWNNLYVAGAPYDPTNLEAFAQQVAFPIAYSFNAPIPGFAVAGETATLEMMHLGRRFAVRGAAANNTTDKEYIIKGGGYDPGTGYTMIYVETVGVPGYIETAVVPLAEGFHWGTIYTSLVRVNRPGRYWLRARARAAGCGHAGLRLSLYSKGNSYDFLTGRCTLPASLSSGHNDRLDCYTPPGELVEGVCEIRANFDYGYPGPAVPVYVEVQQYAEAEFEDPAAGWCSWGCPPALLTGDWWGTWSDLRWASLEIVEANS